MKQCKPTKTWERTRLQNLVRHKSGRYYARAFAGGKEVWKSLKTSHFSVAQAKLAEFLKEHRERVSNGNGEVSAKMTFGEAAAIHLRNLDDNLSIKPRTRDYWRECLAALQKSWPGLNETEVRKITQTDCKEWARAYRKTVSPTRYNNTVSVLRHVLNVAVEAGVVYSNAAAAVKRAAGAREGNRAAEHRQIQRADCGNACGPQPRLSELCRLRVRLGVHRLSCW